MKLSRLSQRRPVGRIIERAAREVLAGQAGHNKLWQHSLAAHLAALPPPANVAAIIAPGSQVGGGEDITGKFVIDFSEIDGSDLIA